MMFCNLNGMFKIWDVKGVYDRFRYDPLIQSNVGQNRPSIKLREKKEFTRSKVSSMRDEERYVGPIHVVLSRRYGPSVLLDDLLDNTTCSGAIGLQVLFMDTGSFSVPCTTIRSSA
jgi:hypothetical protein